jgi:DNA-binding NtrC family response regulator
MVKVSGGADDGATFPQPAASTAPADVMSWLTVVDGDEAHVIALPDHGALLIGRSAACDVVLRNVLASRRHAEIRRQDGRLTIADVGSANGTRVGGRELAPLGEMPLEPGVAVFVGSACLVAHELRAAPSTAHVQSVTELEQRLGRSGPRWLALVRIRLAARLSGAWVVRLLSQTLGDGDFVLDGVEGDAWLVFARAEALEARRAAEAAVARIEPWAFASLQEVSVLPRGSDDDEWIDELGRRLAPRPDLGAAGAVVVREKSMRDLLARVERIAGGTISVLVLGETGVGKDVVASLLHERSPRRERPFLRLNCAVLSESLLESELFGHEAGAFTGARQAKPGLLEVANRGTVFLDEVGELPPAVQAKLLRVLESREVTRLGGLHPRTIDVRFVSATNRDLRKDVSADRFREDLFYRLSGVVLEVPPLRDRRAEIEPLACAFAAEVARGLGRHEPFRFTPAALARMAGHHWPGNVRELRNAVERAALLSDGAVIDAAAFDLEVGLDRRASSEHAPAAPPPADAGGGQARGSADERARIAAALASCAGNQTRAAQILGIARRTLVKKLSRYQIPRPRKPTTLAG